MHLNPVNTTHSAVAILALAQAVCGAATAGPSDALPYAGPANAELDAARQWLWDNPPDGTNRAERQARMAVIVAAADELDAVTARRYLLLSGRIGTAQEKTGALYYLHQATDRALEDIRRTHVTRGLVAWHLYNMGYIFKTPETCFGVDICLKHGERLVPDLDFLLVTHEHIDHHAGGLITAMSGAGKPVITRFSRHGTKLNEPADLRFGPIRVKVDIGDHSRNDPLRINNMLMFQIDCGDAANGCTIYHSGDGSNYEKMTPDRPVDIFIPHVSCSGMLVADAIRHIDPKITFVSHVMELTHSPGGARWTYDYAFNAVSDLPESKAVVLTWGERWILPGTKQNRD